MVSARVAEFGINIALHVFILYTFLTLFFIFFVSRLTKQHVGNAMENAVEDNSTEFLKTIDDWDKKIDPTGKGYIDWNAVDKVAKDMEAKSNRYDPTIPDHNQKLLTGAVITVGVMFGIILIAILYYRFYKNYDINLKGVLVENIVIFTFVGVIEFLFFYYIALKYIPVTPNVVSETVISRLQENLADKIETL